MTTSNRTTHGTADEDNDTIGLNHESSSNSKDNTDAVWKSYNFLSLGYKIFFARFFDHANNRNAQTGAVSVATGRS